MTLARGMERLETERLMLRRVSLADLPFYVRLHGMVEVARGLWLEGRPKTAGQTEAWLRGTLTSYDALELGYLAVVRKADGALIGRCGLMDMAVEAAAPAGRLRRGWFGREEVPEGVAVILECELGYTFDPAVWGQGYASEAARCVWDYARKGLGLGYVVSAILPGNAASRRLAERARARMDGQMGAAGMVFERWVWGAETANRPNPLL
ncbi:MAG TPA: GNAT family N-acetyltransferase [Acetobacteraceae bacterium]|nr:GNAT family N-acetyltransferase [Acetobacteraceae bacterium]